MDICSTSRMEEPKKRRASGTEPPSKKRGKAKKRSVGPSDVEMQSCSELAAAPVVEVTCDGTTVAGHVGTPVIDRHQAQAVRRRRSAALPTSCFTRLSLMARRRSSIGARRDSGKGTGDKQIDNPSDQQECSKENVSG